MFTSEAPEYREKYEAPERFMLLFDTTYHKTTISQFKINREQQVQQPEVVDLDEVIFTLSQLQSTKSAASSSNQSFKLQDPRTLIDNPFIKAWTYTPKNQRLYYEHGSKKINAEFPFPTLLFCLKKNTRELYVAALRYAKRPSSTTRVYHAPLPNVGANGAICLGSVTIPSSLDIDEVSLAYLNSYKTHLNSNVLFRKGDSSNNTYYKWAKQAVKTQKLSLADLSISGTVADFIFNATQFKLEAE